MPTRPRHRWFQFSLRTVFVVMTVFCGLLGYQGRWIYARREAIRSGIAVRHVFGSNQIVPLAPFALRLFGASGERHLFVAPTHFERICELFPESEVLEYGGTERTRPMTLGNSKEISKAAPRKGSTAVFPIPKE